METRFVGPKAEEIEIDIGRVSGGEKVAEHVFRRLFQIYIFITKFLQLFLEQGILEEIVFRSLPALLSFILKFSMIDNFLTPISVSFSVTGYQIS